MARITYASVPNPMAATIFQCKLDAIIILMEYRQVLSELITAIYLLFWEAFSSTLYFPINNNCITPFSPIIQKRTVTVRWEYPVSAIKYGYSKEEIITKIINAFPSFPYICFAEYRILSIVFTSPFDNGLYNAKIAAPDNPASSNVKYCINCWSEVIRPFVSEP